MTSRENRRQRREAERKARKLANKQAAASPAQPAAPAYDADFLVYSREPSDRLASRVGVTVPTRARAEVNRQNSQLSTGPRTPEGKLASSRNAVKHGLASDVPLIPGEDPAELEALRDSLLREHQPADATEQMLLDQLAQSYWLLQRAIRFQNECFTPDGVDEKRLALFLRYGATHERAFHKALNALLRLKKERRQREASPTGFVSQKPAPTASNASHSGFVSHPEVSSVHDSAHCQTLSALKSSAGTEKLSHAA